MKTVKWTIEFLSSNFSFTRVAANQESESKNFEFKHIDTIFEFNIYPQLDDLIGFKVIQLDFILDIEKGIDFFGICENISKTNSYSITFWKQIVRW